MLASTCYMTPDTRLQARGRSSGGGAHRQGRRPMRARPVNAELSCEARLDDDSRPCYTTYKLQRLVCFSDPLDGRVPSRGWRQRSSGGPDTSKPAKTRCRVPSRKRANISAFRARPSRGSLEVLSLPSAVASLRRGVCTDRQQEGCALKTAVRGVATDVRQRFTSGNRKVRLRLGRSR